jgi:hypothetical protein
MAILYDVLMRPIVITAGVNDVIRAEDAPADGIYSATVAPGTYYVLPPGEAGSIFEAVINALFSGSAGFGLNLDWQFATVFYDVVTGEILTNLTHDGVTLAFIRGADAGTTFPLDVVGITTGASVEVPTGAQGLVITCHAQHAWISPQPVYTLDESASRVDVVEMETPSGRSFRAKHSDIKRFRQLSLRNLARGRTLIDNAAAVDATLERFWERSLLERIRLYRPALGIYPNLVAPAAASLVGEYNWTGGALTGFSHRRSRAMRAPLYDVDMDMREVVP